MANMRKLKRRGTLGAPPPIEEASSNLDQPETAPAPPTQQFDRKVKEPAARHSVDAKPEAEALIPPIIDGRTLRRKGRTVQFNARVTPEFHQRIFRLVAAEERPAVDILEDMLCLYEARVR